MESLKYHYFEFQTSLFADKRKTFTLASTDCSLLIIQENCDKNDLLCLPRVSISHNSTPNDHLQRMHNHNTSLQYFTNFLQYGITFLIDKISFRTTLCFRFGLNICKKKTGRQRNVPRIITFAHSHCSAY